MIELYDTTEATKKAECNSKEAFAFFTLTTEAVSDPIAGGFSFEAICIYTKSFFRQVKLIFIGNHKLCVPLYGPAC